MPDFAYVTLTHSEPPSEQISQIDMVVNFGEKEARLHIRPEQPLGFHPPTKEIVALQLRDLGMALLRIADQPSAILLHDPAPRR
jgi:hypothetical protein